jgi:hypothetical protein
MKFTCVSYSKGTCTPMFIAALLLWKQPRCPTTDKWIKTMWMELENIILSKVSQAQKTNNRIFSLICGL